MARTRCGLTGRSSGPARAPTTSRLASAIGMMAGPLSTSVRSCARSMARSSPRASSCTYTALWAVASCVWTLRLTSSGLFVGHDRLQARVLTLDLLQALRIVDLLPAELIAPPVIRVLADLRSARDLGDRLALAEHPVGFAQLADHLLGGCACVASS